jgi:hypothetical protein
MAILERDFMGIISVTYLKVPLFQGKSKNSAAAEQLFGLFRLSGLCRQKKGNWVGQCFGKMKANSHSIL